MRGSPVDVDERGKAAAAIKFDQRVECGCGGELHGSRTAQVANQTGPDLSAAHRGRASDAAGADRGAVRMTTDLWQGGRGRSQAVAAPTPAGGECGPR
jgi:hypothetical protein